MSKETQPIMSESELAFAEKIRAALQGLSAEELHDILIAIPLIKQGWTHTEIARMLMAPVN